ncbi:MAG: DUF4359 domain-containing protein [Flavobacteriales bacterium]
MKKKLIIILLFFTAIVAAAVFTNPSKKDFQEKMEARMKEEYAEEISSPVFKDIAALGLSFVSKVIVDDCQRDEYYVCSVYTVELPIGTYQYLGVFGTFIPLQEKDPIKDISTGTP